jgi:hypothetical protein
MGSTSTGVEFRLDHHWSGARRVTPAVGGRDLIELIGLYESSKGFDAPGDYGGLIIDNFSFGDLNDYLNGRSEGWPGGGRVALLGCTCGVVGCWPLLATVLVTADEVAWDGFQQPYRPERDYSTFGPFVFEPAQYQSAVDVLVSIVAGTA